MNQPDKSAVTLSDRAFWDADKEYFRVPLHGNPDFVALVILKDAPLPLAHLDSSTHDRKTKLGDELHRRLEDEVNAAIARGGQQVATGLILLTPEELQTI